MAGYKPADPALGCIGEEALKTPTRLGLKGEDSPGQSIHVESCRK